MTKAKSTKRALLMSALAILMCVSMLIGSTYAWFTDSVTSAGNTIQSGTLNVDLVDAAGNSLEGKVIKFVDQDANSLWEPGCTYKLEEVFVKNKGTLALKYEIAINGINGDAKLLEAIEWTVTVDGVETALSDLKGYLLAGETSKAIVLTGHMKEEAGNEYQGLTVEGISISVLATQYTYEKDSYDEMYDNIAFVGSDASLREALTAGKNVILTKDVDLGNTPVVVNNDMLIDLNGNTLSGTSTSSTTSYLIKVNSGKELTLTNGEVSFYATNPDTEWGGVGQPAFPGYANNAISCSGTLVVDGATIKNITAPGGASYAVDCYPGANLIVENGVIDGCGKVAIRTFANSATTPINVTINGGTITGKRAIWVQLPANNSAVAPYVNVTVNGGTLISTDPAGDNLALYSYSYGNSFANTKVAFNGGEYYGELVFGGGYKGDKETVIANAANCKFNNDVYRYLENDGTELIQAANSNNAIVTDTATLTEALKDGKNVVLNESIEADPATVAPYGNLVLFTHKGGVFDGNGETITMNDVVNAHSSVDNYAIMTSGGTIKNLNVNGGFRGIMIMNPTQDIYLDNVNVGGDTVCYALNTGEGDGTKNLTITNSTICGWSSIGTAVKSVNFTNCTFGQGTYYTNVYGRLVKPYVDTVFENCEFISKFYIDLSQLGKDGDGNVLNPDAKIVLKNCYVNGVKITAQNWQSLIVSEAECGEGQISIEAKNGSYMSATNVLDYVIFE